MSTDFDQPEALLASGREAVDAAQQAVAQAKQTLRSALNLGEGERVVIPDEQQYQAHVYAWLATTAAGLRQLCAWAEALHGAGKFGEAERNLMIVAMGEGLAQLAGGVPMNQGEVARLSTLLPADATPTELLGPAALSLVQAAESGESHRRLLEAVTAGTTIADGLEDDIELVRDQFRRFADERVVPDAHGWHLRDELIPLEVIQELAALGVFGLTTPEMYGGTGMGKIAMCVVSEELSRAHIGVGSLATRSEIAAELILGGGTEDQKAHWLPKIASGEVIPTAVFTEPEAGSDLGSVRTRAERTDTGWQLTGAKTWITHAARADLMTVMARTDTGVTDHRGLSIFLVPKTRGSDTDPFPDAGLDGSEISVLGYRGMKEYALAFDGFEVGEEALLGGEENNGFRQLMRTFESARIQTAARAVGVAQSAFDLGLRYAGERKQFGKSLLAFPRVYRKLASMLAEIEVARQLTYHAARTKDGGKRCDLEAGMAKLLGARAAWAAADNSLQIHGGNGFALEFPISRVLCDSRILNIFEGAAEIQAAVVARRLLESDQSK